MSEPNRTLPLSTFNAYLLVIVAFVPATGGPLIDSVDAVVIVLAATKLYVGACIRIARWVAIVPVAN